MFGLQPLHIVFIIAIGLLIFGPSRMTELGRSLGSTVKEFRSGVKGPTEEKTDKSEADPS